MTKNRRKQLIINKPFQYKIMIYLMLLITGIIVAFGIALGFSKAVVTQPTVAALSTASPPLLDIIWLPVLITIILAIIGTLLLGLLYSHRIAGPLFNLKRVLNHVENGVLNIEMSIRNKDELHDVEDSFNAMLAGLNSRIHHIKEACSSLNDNDKRKFLSVISEQFKAIDKN